MCKATFVCALILGGALASAQNYPRGNSPQNSYPSYDERNYSNNRWSDTIAAGTNLRVRTDTSIIVRDQANGRVYTGRIAEDVRGENGNVLIPRGANAELMVRNVGDHDMVVDLESISFGDRRYMVNAEAYDRSRHEGIGENKRTGEYVGGGALFGTVLGAIAGGGKGAAIGALAGGAAGAGTEALTKGHTINIPAESVLTFRLDQPLQLGTGRWSHDNGYDRDGYHYHDNYYHRDDDPNNSH